MFLWQGYGVEFVSTFCNLRHHQSYFLFEELPPSHVGINNCPDIKKFHSSSIDKMLIFGNSIRDTYRSWWPCSLRRRSAAAWLFGSRIRIPLNAWMFVSCNFCVCCVGRGLCYELITRSEESYRVCLTTCNLAISTMRRPRPELDYSATKN